MTDQTQDHGAPVQAGSVANGAAWLRDHGIAVRLRISRFGMSRALDSDQRDRAAAEFGAEGDILTARKKILDRRAEPIRAIAAVLNEARMYWLSHTLPWPDDGVRIMRRDQIAEFGAKMDGFIDALTNAVVAANAVYQSDLLPAARDKLGELFDPGDYPTNLMGEWGLAHEFVSVEPPSYLEDLAPEVYAAESQRVAARFEEAVTLAEQSFVAELGKMVANLADSLQPREVTEWKSSYVGEQLEVLTREAAGLQSGEVVDRLMAARAKSIETFGSKVRIVDADGKRKTIDHGSDEAAFQFVQRLGCVRSGSHQENKTFRDSSVGNLAEFFDRFRALSVGSNAELESLVERAKAAVAGQTPDELRAAAPEQRATVQEALAAVGTRLEEMLVARPRRAITLDDDESVGQEG